MNKHRLLSLFNLVLVILASGLAWAAGPSMGRPGTEVLQYNANYSPPSAPPALCRGQTITVPVVVVNQGTLPWDIEKFHLSYHWYALGAVPAGTVPTSPAPNYGAVVFEGLRTQLQNLLAPGQRVTLQAQLQAPPTAGTYTLKWDMVREGVTWFSRKGVSTTDQNVSVLSYLACLHQITQKPGGLPPTPRPTVTELMVFSVVTPGGGVVLLGKDFGTTPGEVRLYLAGPEGSPAPPNVKLLGLTWTDTVVSGTIPDVSGAIDHTAAFVVWKPDPQSSNQLMASNALTVPFTAARQLIYAPEGVARVISCDQSSDKDSCYADFPAGVNFSGGHFDLASDGKKGTDTWAFGPLKNGWAIDGYDWLRRKNVEPDPFGFNAMAPSRYAVNWFFTAGSTDIHAYSDSTDASYELAFRIVGPKGVPYK